MIRKVGEVREKGSVGTAVMILILRVREKDVDVLKTHDIIWPSASIPHLDCFSIIIDVTVVWEKITVLRSPEDEEKRRWYLEGEGD